MSISLRALFAVAVAILAGDPPGVDARSVPATSASSAGFATGSWRQFRFDARHTGFNRFEHVLDAANVPTLTLDWQAQLGQPVFFLLARGRPRRHLHRILRWHAVGVSR